MKPPFHLVHDHAVKDVGELLAQMLAHAQEGQIYGIAFVAMYKGRVIVADAAGECERNPVYSRGLVAVLDDYFRDKIRNGLGGA